MKILRNLVILMMLIAFAGSLEAMFGHGLNGKPNDAMNFNGSKMNSHSQIIGSEAQRSSVDPNAPFVTSRKASPQDLATAAQKFLKQSTQSQVGKSVVPHNKQAAQVSFLTDSYQPSSNNFMANLFARNAQGSLFGGKSVAEQQPAVLQLEPEQQVMPQAKLEEEQVQEIAQPARNFELPVIPLQNQPSFVKPLPDLAAVAQNLSNKSVQNQVQEPLLADQSATGSVVNSPVKKLQTMKIKTPISLAGKRSTIQRNSVALSDPAAQSNQSTVTDVTQSEVGQAEPAEAAVPTVDEYNNAQQSTLMQDQSALVALNSAHQQSGQGLQSLSKASITLNSQQVAEMRAQLSPQARMKLQSYVVNLPGFSKLSPNQFVTLDRGGQLPSLKLKVGDVISFVNDSPIVPGQQKLLITGAAVNDASITRDADVATLQSRTDLQNYIMPINVQPRASHNLNVAQIIDASALPAKAALVSSDQVSLGALSGQQGSGRSLLVNGVVESSVQHANSQVLTPALTQSESYTQSLMARRGSSFDSSRSSNSSYGNSQAAKLLDNSYTGQRYNEVDLNRAMTDALKKAQEVEIAQQLEEAQIAAEDPGVARPAITSIAADAARQSSVQNYDFALGQEGLSSLFDEEVASKQGVLKNQMTASTVAAVAEIPAGTTRIARISAVLVRAKKNLLLSLGIKSKDLSTQQNDDANATLATGVQEVAGSSDSVGYSSAISRMISRLIAIFSRKPVVDSSANSASRSNQGIVVAG